MNWITTRVRDDRSATFANIFVALYGVTLLACGQFFSAFAQSATVSAQASPQVETEYQISLEGSISIVIFVIASFLLLRWALREKHQPGKRYHRSFAPLCQDDSDKQARYRRDADDDDEYTSEDGGAGHGGSD